MESQPDRLSTLQRAASSVTPVEDANADPSPRPTKRQRGKKTNVTRACENCRRKRTKCDGRPRCSSCQLHDLECGYGPEKDGRRLASKQYVHALEYRIHQLEHQIKRAGGAKGREEAEHEGGKRVHGRRQDHRSPISQGSANGDQGEQPGQDDEGDDQSVSDGETQGGGGGSGAGRTIGALKISGQGSVAHYGPSSAYMHLPDEVQQQSSVAEEDDDDPSTSANGSPQSLSDVDWSSIAWNRYLSPTARLSSETHVELLGVFFRYLNWWCQYCDQALFLRDLVHACEASSQDGQRTAPSRTPHYSPLLHNVILALALVNSPETLPPEDGDAKVLASLLATHANSLIEEEMLRPMTTTAIGIMLLGSYYFHSLHRNLGWNYAGMGARTAQLLGLNTDCQDLVDRGLLSMKMKHHRDRTFWTVFVQDSLWSFNVGRTPTLNIEDYKTALPLVRDKEDEEPWIADPAATRGVLGGDAASGSGGAISLPLGRPAWRSSCLLWTAKLIMIGNNIHRSLYRVRQPPSNTMPGLISKLEVDLGAWLVNLVSPLRVEAWQGEVMPPHIINMHAVFNYLRILLHRPACYDFLSVEADARQVSLEACEAAARQIVSLFERSPSVRHSTTTLPNIAFTAGTTFLLVAARNDLPLPAVREALSKVDQCIGFLRQMSWPAAQVATDMLQRLKNEWLPPGLDDDGRVATADAMSSVIGSLGRDGSLDKSTVEALNNPESEIAKLLKSMGWQPPTTLTAAQLQAPMHTQQSSLGQTLLPQGLVSQVSSRVSTPSALLSSFTQGGSQLGQGSSTSSVAYNANGNGNGVPNLASSSSTLQPNYGLNMPTYASVPGESDLNLNLNMGMATGMGVDWGNLSAMFGDSIAHPLWDPLSTWSMGNYDGGAM